MADLWQKTSDKMQSRKWEKQGNSTTLQQTDVAKTNPVTKCSTSKSFLKNTGF